MTLEDINKLFKFSWAQAFSDYSGKSSIMAIVGFFLSVIGGLGFIYSLFLKDATGETNALLFATLGAGLLGYRKGVDGKADKLPIDDTDKTKITQTNTTSTEITTPST